MNSEQELLNRTLETAYQNFSKDEMQSWGSQARKTFFALLGKRLRQPEPPTKDELLGIKELATEWLSHPALRKLSQPLPTSQASNSPTSASPKMTEPQLGKPSEPIREGYETQEDYEEALGFYRSRHGRIKAMVESQARQVASQTEASKASPEMSADSSPAAGSQPNK